MLQNVRNLPTKIFLQLAVLVFAVSCQTPTQVTEVDKSLETRVFSKITQSKKVVDLKRAVIVDVRSRFEHEMSRPPRSFFAYWKDWDLRGFSGERLQNKKKELQKLLSLQGVDPLVQVVIMGNGLKGDGEEFLVASTLYSLGINRIRFLNAKQAKKAMVAKGLPKLENLDYWEKPLVHQFNCDIAGDDKALRGKADVILDGESQEYFYSTLDLKNKKLPKTLRPRVYSPGTHWAYGVALFLKEQGRQPCVL